MATATQQASSGTGYNMSYAVYFYCTKGSIPPAQVSEFGNRTARVNGDTSLRLQLRKQLASDQDREVDFEEKIPEDTYRILVPWYKGSQPPDLSAIDGIEVITMTAFPT